MSTTVTPGNPATAEDQWGTTGARQVVVEHVSPGRAAIRRFLRHRLAIVGVLMVAIIVVMAIIAPLLSPWPAVLRRL